MNFFLLVLKTPLDFSLDVSYKQCEFFKILSKKNFEFILNSVDGIVAFYLSFVLLSVKFNFISKIQDYKEDLLVAYSINYVKMAFALLIIIITLYVQILIIQVDVLDFHNYILGYKVCFAMFLVFNKQF